MIQLLARDKHRAKVENAVAELARRLADHPHAEGVRISGPAPAPLERLRNEWRYQILLRGPSGKRLRQMVTDVLSPRPAVEVAVDVDPYQLL
jgi:primosomal protein N' (replication factor Y)